MYDIERIVNKAGGIEYIKHLIEEEGYTYPEINSVLGIRTSSRIVTKKFIEYCAAVVPFPKVSNSASRKWMIRWSKCDGAYWADEYLVDQTILKLQTPILNKAGNSKRYNISMWGHPYANNDSYQVRAHQIVWELDNECYLPDGYEVEPIDGDFLNLDVSNFRLRTTSGRKSYYATGERNHFYTGTARYVNYTRGWTRLSKAYRNSINKCEICSSTDNLNTHHIISYWLFEEQDYRVHDSNNLLCVCDSCHGKIHSNNTTIVPHISEMKYKNLLELLESLKSQVPDTLMETYRAVEKQLGLTDNQQPSI